MGADVVKGDGQLNASNLESCLSLYEVCVCVGFLCVYTAGDGFDGLAVWESFNHPPSSCQVVPIIMTFKTIIISLT